MHAKLPHTLRFTCRNDYTAREGITCFDSRVVFSEEGIGGMEEKRGTVPVSYTHLTLPTSSYV